MSRRKKKSIDVFNISFLDLLSGALGAVIILFITVPKNKSNEELEVRVKNKCQVENQVLGKCLSTIKNKDKVIDEVRASNSNLIKEIEEMKKFTASSTKTAKQVVTKDTNSGVSDNDVGFKFKGKNIVFLIDVSGSMKGEKIGQVKAGLKMLIASMGKEYKVDIVYFPHDRNQNYYSLWGNLQSMHSQSIKNEIYNFLASLTPRGMTPTRAVLKYALSQYPELTDIILLSDGSPTIPGSRTVDNYEDIVKEIKWHNAREVQINTIGVGHKVFKNSSNTLYKFLKLLSESTQGFFYGF